MKQEDRHPGILVIDPVYFFLYHSRYIPFHHLHSLLELHSHVLMNNKHRQELRIRLLSEPKRNSPQGLGFKNFKIFKERGFGFAILEKTNSHHPGGRHLFQKKQGEAFKSRNAEVVERSPLGGEKRKTENAGLYGGKSRTSDGRNVTETS